MKPMKTKIEMKSVLLTTLVSALKIESSVRDKPTLINLLLRPDRQSRHYTDLLCRINWSHITGQLMLGQSAVT